MSESALGAEYEFSSNYAIGLTFIRRNLERILEDALSPTAATTSVTRARV